MEAAATHGISGIFRKGYHRPDTGWFLIPTQGTFRWKERFDHLTYRYGMTSACTDEVQVQGGCTCSRPAFHKASGLSEYPDNQESFFQLNQDNQAVPRPKVQYCTDYWDYP